MKKITVLFLFSFLIAKSYSQISKRNWLVGGNVRISSQSETLSSFDVKGFNVALSPNAGYFFIDKFAGGIRAQLAYDKVKFNGGTSKTTQFGIGPFFRYYFLAVANRANLFGETEYKYLYNSSNSGAPSQNSNAFTFSAGPVIYFNTVVGIELTANYELFNTKSNETNAKTFFIAIGFQIHLEKEKSQ